MPKIFSGNPYRRQAYYAFFLSVAAMTILSAAMFYGVVRPVIQRDRERIVEGVAGEMKTDIEDQLRIEMVSVRSVQEFAQLDHMLHNQEYSGLLHDLLRKNKDIDLTMLVGSPDDKGRHPVLVSSLSDEYRQVTIPYAEDVLPAESAWLETARQEAVAGNALGWRSIEYLSKLNSFGSSNQSHYFVLVCPVLHHAPPISRELIIAIINFQSFQSVMDQAESLLKRANLTSGYAFLLGPDGDTVLAHKNQAWIGLRVSTAFDLPALQNVAVSVKDGDTRIMYYILHPLRSDKFRSAVANPQDIAFGHKFAALVAIKPPSNPEFDFGDDFNWKLAVGVNYLDAVALAMQMRPWFFLTPMALAFCVLAVILYLSRWMKMSLLEFAQLARDTAEGKGGPLKVPVREDQLDQVKDAFNEVLISIRSGISFVPIVNPYVVGTPIRTNEMFFGRVEDLAWIGRQLEAKNNLIIGLFGPRRIGKTSLLHQIKQGRATQAVSPILLDTQQFVPGLASDSDFYAAISKYLRLRLTDFQISGSQLETPPTPDGVNTLLKLLKSVDPNKKPVLLFDESKFRLQI